MLRRTLLSLNTRALRPGPSAAGTTRVAASMSFSYQSTQNASLSPWALRSFSTAARTASAAAHGVVSTNFFDLKAKDKHHQEVNLSDFKGKVVLVVNVASKCGFTDQYKGLEELYKNYKDKGFVIIGFPCNQFGGQEPGTNEEIESFSQVNYGITFPLMDKIDVNGNKEDSVYTFLKSQKTGVMGLSRIKWNFEKFLIARDGTVFQRYSPVTIPSEMIQDIEKLLSPA